MTDLATALSILTLALGLLALGIWIFDLPHRRARAEELRMSAAHQAALFAELQDVLDQRRAIVDRLAASHAGIGESRARAHREHAVWHHGHSYVHAGWHSQARDPHPYQRVPSYPEVPVCWPSSA